MPTKISSKPLQTKAINLANLFSNVAGAIASQRQTLNQADSDNHNHGDNMADTFNVIAQAMKEKQNASPADQLAYASQLLRQKQSGSAQMYAQGLAQASKEFLGQKNVNADNVLGLIQSLLGAGQASTAQTSGTGDLLGSLLGAATGTSTQNQSVGADLLGTLFGGGTAASTQQAQSGGGNLLGSFLGGASGTQQGQTSGLGLDDLLNAGMAYVNTTSQGGTPVQGLVNALVSSSVLGNSSTHRNESSTVVVNSLLSALGGMLGKK